MHSRRTLREGRDINSALMDQRRKQSDFGTPLWQRSVADPDLFREANTPVQQGVSFENHTLLSDLAMGHPPSCFICGTDEMFSEG